MSDSVSSVSATDIPQHLEAMVELLCDEDSQKDTQDPGTMVGGEQHRDIGVGGDRLVTSYHLIPDKSL